MIVCIHLFGCTKLISLYVLSKTISVNLLFSFFTVSSVYVSSSSTYAFLYKKMQTFYTIQLSKSICLAISKMNFLTNDVSLNRYFYINTYLSYRLAKWVSVYVTPFTIDIGISHEAASHVFSETVLQKTINYKHSWIFEFALPPFAISLFTSWKCWWNQKFLKIETFSSTYYYFEIDVFVSISNYVFLDRLLNKIPKH